MVYWLFKNYCYLQLTFTIWEIGSLPFRGAHFGSGSGPIFLDQLNCNGTERSLLECPPSRPTGLHDCSHNKDAGVRCIGKSEVIEALLYYVIRSVTQYYHLRWKL